jgi:hypothetical protein
MNSLGLGTGIRMCNIDVMKMKLIGEKKSRRYV